PLERAAHESALKLTLAEIVHASTLDALTEDIVQKRAEALVKHGLARDIEDSGPPQALTAQVFDLAALAKTKFPQSDLHHRIGTQYGLGVIEATGAQLTTLKPEMKKAQKSLIVTANRDALLSYLPDVLRSRRLTPADATKQVNAWRTAATTHTTSDDTVADYAVLLVSDIAFARAVQNGTGHREYLTALWMFAATGMTEGSALHLVTRTTVVRASQGVDRTSTGLAI